MVEDLAKVDTKRGELQAQVEMHVVVIILLCKRSTRQRVGANAGGVTQGHLMRTLTVMAGTAIPRMEMSVEEVGIGKKRGLRLMAASIIAIAALNASSQSILS